MGSGEKPMQIVYEKEATITQLGGSMYIRLDEPFFTTLGVSRPSEQGKLENHDAKIALGIGKHGKFVFLYSPSEQKKWKREQKKMEG